MEKSRSQIIVANVVIHFLISHGISKTVKNKMGAIVIVCHCGSDKVNHVRMIEVDVATYKHIFVCKDCETTMVFRLSQILAAKCDPSYLV